MFETQLSLVKRYTSGKLTVSQDFLLSCVITAVIRFTLKLKCVRSVKSWQMHRNAVSASSLFANINSLVFSDYKKSRSANLSAQLRESEGKTGIRSQVPVRSRESAERSGSLSHPSLFQSEV